ncbi:glycosyltransferase [Patescibacteria group bacterium]
MKLLITTQKLDINDASFNFFNSWIREFAKNCEKVTVICLEKGEYDLPDNVNVLSLGKEEIKYPPVSPPDWTVVRAGPLGKGGGYKLLYVWRFYKYIWQERKNYDAVFVHMNPEYVILGGIFWKLFKKKISLWYVHRAVNLKLRIAEKVSDVIFTVAKESFRINSSKVKVLGHGIDMSKNNFIAGNSHEKFNIALVGRITKIKNQKLLVDIADILINKLQEKEFKFNLIGSPVSREDKKYHDEVKNLIKKKELSAYIKFLGNAQNQHIYDNVDLSINLCPTGGLDKVVLEAMARGCIVVSSNRGFDGILPDRLLIKDVNPEMIAKKIMDIKNMPESEKEQLRKKSRNEVEQNHNLEKLVEKIMKELYVSSRA